jgi:hypothetical protein
VIHILQFPLEYVQTILNDLSQACDTPILQIISNANPLRYSNPSNLSLGVSVGYVQSISKDVAQASRLVSPLISRICHHSGNDILCGHKSIVACASHLQLLDMVPISRPTFCSIQHGQSDCSHIEYSF